MKSLRHTLALMIASGIVAATALTAVSIWGSASGGSAARRAFVAKDVTADILPPPMYLIELRLVLSEAVEGTLTADKARTEAVRLQKEYRERASYWNEHRPYGLETHLLGAQHAAAQRFIDASSAVLKAVEGADR